MRSRRVLIVILIAAVVGGCAHTGGAPPRTAMVEVTDGSIVPGPSPAPKREAPVAMPRRRSLMLAGGVLTVVGAVITGIGVGLYVGGTQRDSSCTDPAAPCDAGGRFGWVVGGIVLGLGVPNAAAGIALIGAGAATHR